MFGLFGRARAKANLTPAERAVLKLIEGVLLAGLVAAAPSWRRRWRVSIRIC